MDSTSLNHYEERLYSVFKTFDVDNEEALNKAAVLALCDALQLEQRGAALVDTLFERRDQRVTFAQFRSGLLAVLGDPPSAAPSAARSDSADPAASDDDSSGREVAPKFVFGSKKYGRRSRPSRARLVTSTPGSPLEPAPQPPTESTSDLELDHSSRVDCDRALQLCCRLRMDGIDRRLVERIFESVPAGETTVGEFFDRLNASLSSSIDSAVTVAQVGGVATVRNDHDEEDALPTELVLEAWERAGVQRPRRLLAELGFEGAALAAPGLERVLDEEISAFPEPADARAVLLRAALALARLRCDRAARNAADAAAERDRLRADVDEANRRARILAQEVDENHARLEAELTANLRRTEAKHAEALRCVEAERVAERERATAERATLEAELVRRVEIEQKLRAEADVHRKRVTQLEARAAAAEVRVEAGERERARLAAEVRAAEARAGGETGAAERAAAALAACADELRLENARLRDRCDELCAQLEARPGLARPRSPPHTWHEEAGVVAHPDIAVPVANEEGESPPVSLEPSLPPEPCGAITAAADSEAAALRAQLADAEARHADEKQKLEELVKELESSLEAMRVEYERCEEYWSGKLDDERELLAEEQRAGDERLAELAAKIAEYERQFAAPARLATIPEAPALERQAAELDAAAAELRRRADELTRREGALASRDADHARRDADLQRRRDELQRRERELQRRAAALDALRRRLSASAAGVEGGGGGTCAGAAGGEAELRARLLRAEAGAAGGEAELRARLLRAEAGAARLAARLAAADLLVKDLYVENCLLGPAPRRL